MQVKYNSFSTDFKVPFGAVLRHTKVQFSVQVSGPAVRVELCMVHDGQWDAEHVVPMVRVQTGTAQYMATYTPSQAGLYFYYFRIQTATETVFYGCIDGGYGGPGTNYQQRNQVQMYQLTVLKAIEQLPRWYREGVAYQIFVDRFANGNDDGHVNAPKADSFIYGQLTDAPLYIRNEQHEILRWDFYGGNLRGIRLKIPYLQQLGVTILYLTPIFQASSNHRYDTEDFFKIDPVLGDLADFDQLVAALHQAGIRLILDGVFNHVGADSKYFNQAGHYATVGAAQSKDSPYYPWFSFKHYPDDYQSWWGIRNLPTIDKMNQSYQDFIYGRGDSVIDYWTSRGVDGWRLDVADELPDAFIAGIRHALDRYPDKVLIGEVWEDASHKIAYGSRRHYLEGGYLQAVMNYPLRQLIVQVLTGKLTPSEWWRKLMTLKENYPAATFQANFNNLGSHDTPRILTVLADDRVHLQVAIQMLLTLPGVPCLYYGDEAGMTGGKDPDNRAFYPWKTADQQLRQFVTYWVTWRRQQSWLKTANFRPFYVADYGIGYVYWQGSRAIFVMINVTAISQRLTAADFELSGLPDYIERAIRKWSAGRTLGANACQLVENFTQSLHEVDSGIK